MSYLPDRVPDEIHVHDTGGTTETFLSLEGDPADLFGGAPILVHGSNAGIIPTPDTRYVAIGHLICPDPHEHVPGGGCGTLHDTAFLWPETSFKEFAEICNRLVEWLEANPT